MSQVLLWAAQTSHHPVLIEELNGAITSDCWANSLISAAIESFELIPQ
jgi:hypothetical protein